MDDVGDFNTQFRNNLSPAKAGEWQAVRSRLVVGETVCGVVVARRPFGVFVDIGLGFHALLEITQFEDARQRRYAFEDYPAIGQTMTARVIAFNDGNRQIGLTQLINTTPRTRPDEGD